MKPVSRKKEECPVAYVLGPGSEPKVTISELVIPKGVTFDFAPTHTRRQHKAFLTAFIAINENETMEITIPRLSTLERFLVDGVNGATSGTIETVEGCFAGCLRRLYDEAGIEIPMAFDPEVEASRLIEAIRAKA